MTQNTSSPMDLEQGLADLQRKIDELHIPTFAYAALGVINDGYYLSVVDGEDTSIVHREYKSQDHYTEIVNVLERISQETNIKIVAITILSSKEERELGSRLWLEGDIVPFFVVEDVIDEKTVHDAAIHTSTGFNEHGLVQIPISLHQEVFPGKLVTEHDYKQIADQKAWKLLQQQIKAFIMHQRPILFINATPQGGGVALMRHALLRLYRELNVPAHWHIMQPNSDVFEITKRKFHNVLQGVAPEETQLTDHDVDVYLSWISENAQKLQEVIKQVAVVIIDDPQPAGLIPHIRKLNKEAKIIYRSHIHLDRDLLAQEGTPAYRTWQFLWQFIKQADVFVSHPVPAFIPYEASEMAVTMPATTDRLDGLNKELTDSQMKYYLTLFNKILLEHDQTPLEETRPYIIQIARFDPSKGISDVIESYRLLLEKLPDHQPRPQLVLVGHGSIDDPDGVPVYNMTLNLLHNETYRHLASDVKVVRLHHNDQILNALLRASKIVLQLSHKEGFEVKVSEALDKGKPVIAYRAGGIPLQVQDGLNGYLIDIENCGEVADKMFELLTDSKRYQMMSDAARRCVDPNYFTLYNGMKWLYLANQLLNNNPSLAKGHSVTNLMGLPKYTC